MKAKHDVIWRMEYTITKHVETKRGIQEFPVEIVPALKMDVLRAQMAQEDAIMMIIESVRCRTVSMVNGLTITHVLLLHVQTMGNVVNVSTTLMSVSNTMGISPLPYVNGAMPRKSQ